MAKIKLNLDSSEPITFLREVAIPTPSGAELKIGFHFKHRTREQMADLIEAHAKKADEHAEKAKADFDAQTAAAEKAEKAGKKPPATRPLADYTREAIARDVQAVMDVASDWEVEGIAFNTEALTKFFSFYAGAARAITADYRVSMNEGRLGN